jgi:hypothetical protein
MSLFRTATGLTMLVHCDLHLRMTFRLENKRNLTHRSEYTSLNVLKDQPRSLYCRYDIEDWTFFYDLTESELSHLRIPLSQCIFAKIELTTSKIPEAWGRLKCAVMNCTLWTNFVPGDDIKFRDICFLIFGFIGQRADFGKHIFGGCPGSPAL